MSLGQKSYEALLEEIKELEKENQILKSTILSADIQQTKVSDLLQFTQYSIDTISDSILWIDENGKYVFVNNAACKNYGYSKEEFLSMQMLQVDPLFTKEIWDAHWQEILEKKTFTLETINKRKDGTPFPIEVTVNLVEYGGKKYNCAIIRDITEQKLNEAKLKQTATRLEEVIATKDKFFSIIAHDLRGPLGTHREFAKHLSERISDFSESEREINLQVLSESSENLYSLMENLLNWARNQSGYIQFLPIRIQMFVLIQSILELLELSIQKKQIQIQNQIPDNLEIIADQFMIETIFRNLLTNAIKYSFINQTITIGYEKIKKEGEIPTFTHRFFVKDEGVGMTKDQIQSLFRLDKKVSTLGTNSEKGTGLGLIVSKDFIEKHNGKLWVESEPKIGSTFFLELGQIAIE
ncbi:PAS domain-containing sensor histidine kinase [Leptospira yanagawae]|uniref:histidine kinase n=1 Tax=Leptospira yanagawae TaxID=293069 RepID=A0ABY2M7T6_9LEPT|nr:HAMP domain-containing sensor histidine kinase [Leptospira yanagawae]TGL23987.1 PAS domain-containing sensor histidine kinase [Leptospira yanagawae]